MDKIVICYINRYAIGGGLQLAPACDIRVCTRDAELGLPAISEGLIPGLGTLRLARYVGLGRAKRLTFLGERIGADEANRIGLVDHLVDADSGASDFKSILQRYLETASKGCRLSKLALLQCIDFGFDQFFANYIELQKKAMASGDYKEAMAAYREDRAPHWQ